MFEVPSVLSRAQSALQGLLPSTRRFVYADLPRSGLGNKVLVWGRALAFAHVNRIPLFVHGWVQLKLGPILRRERSARLYFGYFDDPRVVGPLGRLLLRRAARQIREPEGLTPPADGAVTAYVFNELPHWSDTFKGLRDQRAIVRDAFNAIVHPAQRRALDRLAAPVLGVHIRQGDFRALRPDEDFAKVGHVRAPLAYFRSRIVALRRVCGEVPVTVFSDGRDADLAEILTMPGVRRSTAPSDLVDLLLLARSQVILAAPGSSFGALAGYLADAPLLHHPDHYHAPARPPEVNERWYEGPIGEEPERWPALLLENLKRVTPVPR